MAGLRDKGVVARSLSSAAAASVFLMVVLPVQTYLANSSAYAFALSRLLMEQTVAAVALSCVLFALFWISEAFLRGFLSSLAVAVLAFAYLESGPLSFGLPEIDGNLSPEFGNVARMVWDLAVLAGLVVAALAFRRFIRRWFHLAALAVLAMGVASLFDVRKDDMSGAAVEDGTGFALNSDIADAIEYSPVRNVIVLTTDSMTADDSAEILAADGDLAGKFDGFVLYRNNVGAMDGTARGVPGMMTGKYIEEGQTQADFTMSMLGEDSLFRAFERHGDAVYCMLDSFPYGYSNAEVERRAPEAPKGYVPCVFRHSRDVPFLSVDSVVKFRVLPFIAKGKYLWAKLHSRRANGDKLYVHEHVLFPRLAKQPVSGDRRQMFAFVHSYGSHMPLVFDADGNHLGKVPKGYPAMRQAVSNVLVNAARLMDAYRERGLYENSFIVIAADHGSDYARSVPGGNPRASTLLMVKGDGWDGPLRFDDTPTSHINLKKAILGSIDRALSPEDTASLLRSDRRLLRILDRTRGAYWDYVYGPDGKPISSGKAFDRCR